MGQGTTTEVSTYIREIMIVALRGSAASLAVAHNHPSGNPTPSNSDKRLTRDLVYAGQTLRIRLQDHVIIGDNDYYSFAEQGHIKRYENQWLKNLGSEPDGG